jgi:hypothetical protein
MLDDPSPSPVSAGGALKRHPWPAFALLGLAPVVAFAFGSVLVTADAFAAVFPALAAVLITGDGDALEPLPEHRTKRLFVAAGVFVILGGVRFAAMGFDSPVYAMVVVGAPSAIAAWILSGVYSPLPSVRRLVRGLASVRASRGAWLVAALAWPAAGALTVALLDRRPGFSVVAPGRSDLWLLAMWTMVGVFNSALMALAWFGFAARRLSPRLSPLATGLLIGAAQWLVVWTPTLRWNSPITPFFLSGVAGSAAAGVAGVWVLQRSRGSLMPVWLMGTLAYASRGLAFLAVHVGLHARSDGVSVAFATAEVALAVALVIAGRMWRRPATAEVPTPAADTAA